MSPDALRDLDADPGEAVLRFADPASGAELVVALRDPDRGPAFGGLRRAAYPDPAAAERDARLLARSMSRKAALVGLPAGGGKGVLRDGPGLDREAAYRFVGRVVEELGGRWYTGPDVGTGERELAWLAAGTRFATDPGPDGPGLLAEATQAGVLAGVEAALVALDGEVDWPRRTVCVQGLGAVGGGLAATLLEAGARVVGADADPERAAAARALGVEVVAPEAALEVECDVLSPNALGGAIDEGVVPRLRARAVAGGANDAVASEAAAAALHARGVLHCPEFAINAGALVRGALFHLEGRREPLGAISARIRRVADAVLAGARERDVPPVREALDAVARGGPRAGRAAGGESRAARSHDSP